MNLSGENYRSVAENRGFTFYSSFVANGQTGVGEFILSGENNKIQFDFKSGRIIDPLGRYVYSFKDSDTIKISGDVGTTGYSYHINDEPFAYGYSKNNFKLQKFFYNSTGMKFANVDTRILRYPDTAPSYYLDFPSSFTTSGYHTGHLYNNDSDLGFEILSAEVVHAYSDFWKVIQTDKTVAPSSSAKIVVQDLSGAAPYSTHDYNLKVNTNFGKIETGVSVLSNPQDFKSLEFSVVKLADGISETGAEFGYHHEGQKTNTYTVFYDVHSGEYPSGNKPLRISLEYADGTTGDFFGGPNGTTPAGAPFLRAERIFNTSGLTVSELMSPVYVATKSGEVQDIRYVEGSGYFGTDSQLLLTGTAHTGNVISGYSLGSARLLVYATGTTGVPDLSGVVRITDYPVDLPFIATGSGLLTESYASNGGTSYYYGTDYVQSTGELTGFFTGTRIPPEYYGKRFYQEYVTGGHDVVNTGGATDSQWGATIVNSSVKATDSAYANSGITGVTLHSGYWTGDVIASGDTYYSGKVAFTGELTGYKKSFTGSFDLGTGVDSSFFESGFAWGSHGNVGEGLYTGYKSYPDPYIMDSGEYGLVVMVRFNNNFDYEPLTALLTISGIDDVSANDNVYTEYITGVR